jgi:hypothetical protein
VQPWPASPAQSWEAKHRDILSGTSPEFRWSPSRGAVTARDSPAAVAREQLGNIRSAGVLRFGDSDSDFGEEEEVGRRGETALERRNQQREGQLRQLLREGGAAQQPSAAHVRVGDVEHHRTGVQRRASPLRRDGSGVSPVEEVGHA